MYYKLKALLLCLSIENNALLLRVNSIKFNSNELCPAFQLQGLSIKTE